VRLSLPLEHLAKENLDPPIEVHPVLRPLEAVALRGPMARNTLSGYFWTHVSNQG
jgi:hypothetical protein